MASMFIATVMGWYMVAFGCLLLFRDEHVKLVMTDIMSQRGVNFILGIILFLLGMMVVVTHNVWVMGWEVEITIVGWILIIVGVLRMYLPGTKMMSQSFLHHPTKMKLVGVLLVILGGFLLFHVYHFHL